MSGSALVRRGFFVLVLLVLLALPFIAPNSYVLNLLVLTALYVGLAVSYELIAGEVGALSLAHPAFYGLGAYLVAILAANYNLPAVATLPIAAVLAALLALAVGIPSLRLSGYAFAIGTLGFATISQLVAKNWIEVTRGPMCVTGVPPASLLGTTFSGLQPFYFLIVGVVVVLFIFTRQMTVTRIGRTFKAIREDEALASAVGIGSNKYRLIAFAASAGLAGILGGTYAYYIQVVCPSELDLSLTLTLLVILFIGGMGSLRGSVLAAILITALPEIFRVAHEWRLVAYGVALLLTINLFPGGIEEILTRIERRLRRSSLGDSQEGVP